MYDNIQESMDCPTEDVINDDDMLDGWFIVQNRKREKDKKEKDVDLAEKIARQLFGKVKNQKTKLEDGTVKEEEVYIPTDLDADQVQKIWEVLQDKKREREAHDKASADAQKKTSEDNDVISRMESALAS